MNVDFAMDRHTLTTIVITAVITATVTIFVTEVFNVLKKTLASSVLKETVRKKLSRKVRAVVWSVLFFLFSLLWVWSDITKPGPPTRWQIADLVVSIIVSFIWVAMTLFNLASLAASREDKDHAV